MVEIVTGASEEDLILATYCEECKHGNCEWCYVTDLLYDATEATDDETENR